MITDELFTAFDLTLRAALRHDPAARHQLQQLNNKVLKVNCRLPALVPSNQSLYLAIIDGHPELNNKAPVDTVDAEVSGKASDFLKTLTTQKPGLASGLQIRGDSQFVLSLQSCMQSLSIDWEGWLADHIGDLPAHQFAGYVNTGQGYCQQVHSSLQRSISDYLHEELRATPSRLELENFYTDVDAIRLQADRLAARVNNLTSPQKTMKNDAQAAIDPDSFGS